jgi:hypothetical protein
VSPEPRETIPAGVSPAGPRLAPVQPTHRPTWLLLLSCLTLGYGGLLLISGMSTLRDPKAVARVPSSAQPMAPAAEALSRKLATLGAAVADRHRRALRAGAAGSVAAGLIMLYAAAAALARDKHGRAAILTAAWAGIAYQGLSLLVVIPLARDYVAASAPLVVEEARASQAEDGETIQPDAALALVRSAVYGIPVVMAAIGVAGSALLIHYFGGWRGRRLYGLEPVREPR